MIDLERFSAHEQACIDEQILHRDIEMKIKNFINEKLKSLYFKESDRRWVTAVKVEICMDYKPSYNPREDAIVINLIISPYVFRFVDEKLDEALGEVKIHRKIICPIAICPRYPADCVKSNMLRAFSDINGDNHEGSFMREQLHKICWKIERDISTVPNIYCMNQTK